MCVVTGRPASFIASRDYDQNAPFFDDVIDCAFQPAHAIVRAQVVTLAQIDDCRPTQSSGKFLYVLYCVQDVC
jgi:hypothetical protein